MKKIIVAAAVVSAIALAGCGGGAPTSASAPSTSSASPEASASVASAPAAQADFDGTGMKDTGAGAMTLATAGGTSEGGNVPQVAGMGENAMIQIGLNYEGGDGTLCTVYVDGMELQKLNAAKGSQSTITLEGQAVLDGVHKVEMVAMDGDKVKLYKSAQYEIVS